MPYLDVIPLEDGEVLPPKYTLVKAGRNDSKIAVKPGHPSGTFGRYDTTPKGRKQAIAAAWDFFPFSREEWAVRERDHRAMNLVREHGHPLHVMANYEDGVCWWAVGVPSGKYTGEWMDDPADAFIDALEG